jgi:DNA-binding NarL/FixJ family response regulator
MIRLAIVEDNHIYLDALELYLQKVHIIELVHTASDLKTMPALVAARPDVVIMDIGLSANPVIKGVRLIKKALPGTAIFMLTLFYDEKKIVQSIRAGASGYLLKKDSPKKIVEAIKNLHKGERASDNGQ